ncbi:MAG: hypothetical protein CMJ83_19965 [Planctomycetes bacterium]|nr:hypothetical protein [Planctomycetota bacterium]
MFLGLGVLFVAVGTVGIFLPVLPTTPFILLAAACFARGSRRAHAWLLRTRVFGPMIERWQRERTISVRAKLTAVSLQTFTIGAAVIWAAEYPAAWVPLVVIGVGVSVYVLRIPTTRDT